MSRNQNIREHGIMYCMDAKKQTMHQAISNIVLASLKRTNKSPEVLEVHPSMIVGKDTFVAGIHLVATAGIAPGHFFQKL